MQWFYSPSVNAFFNDEVHKEMPSDVVKVSAQAHERMMDGQADGKLIVPGSNGRPTLKIPTVDSKKALAKAKDQQKSLIASWREEALANGVKYDGEVYQADSGSCNLLANIVATTGAGIPLPDGFVWRTKDNRNINMTADALKGLWQAMLEYVEKCQHKAWTLKDAVNQATTIDTVQSITWQ